MTNLQPVVMEANSTEIFSCKEFGNLTVIEMGNEPWFIGKEVAEKLGYARGAKAISDHVDSDDRDEIPIQDSIGRMQKTPIINESGLYSLVLSSKLDGAKRFKRWVTKEVLPSIRKHGMYATEELLDNPDLLIATATRLKEEKEKRILAEMANAKLIEENTALKPKAAFADMVDCSANSISVGTMAKILKNKGLTDMGPNQFFDWLRLHGYLMRRDGDNVPTRRSIDLKVIEPKERVVGNPDCPIVRITPKVTGKGQRYFVDKFIKMNAEV